MTRRNTRHGGDPYRTTARFQSTCSKCGEPIKKGAQIIYWPRDRAAYHEKCGEAEYGQFQLNVQDEENYARSYPGGCY